MVCHIVGYHLAIETRFPSCSPREVVLRIMGLVAILGSLLKSAHGVPNRRVLARSRLSP